jgi:ubiquinone/menaquinone biosynthesis C-methylase UbiE
MPAGSTIGENDTVLVVAPDDTKLIDDVLDRLGLDGAVIVVAHSAARLEELEHAYPDPRVSYLIGDPDVLPLPDASVDVVLGSEPPREEVARVLRR